MHWSQPGEKKLTGGTNWQPKTGPSTTWNPAAMVTPLLHLSAPASLPFLFLLSEPNVYLWCAIVHTERRAFPTIRKCTTAVIFSFTSLLSEQHWHALVSINTSHSAAQICQKPRSQPHLCREYINTVALSMFRPGLGALATLRSVWAASARRISVQASVEFRTAFH